jgi:hypothetical protein
MQKRVTHIGPMRWLYGSLAQSAALTKLPNLISTYTQLEVSPNFTLFALQQGWATLFDSRATLETKLVDAGQYKYNKDQFDMTLEKKMGFWLPIFSKEASQKAFFKCFINLKKCSRAWRAACCPGLLYTVHQKEHCDSTGVKTCS